MKHITLILGFTVTLFGQRLETALDEKSRKPMLVGIAVRADIMKDSYGEWYAQEYEDYEINHDLVIASRDFLDSIEVQVFLGTWCEDSRREVPRFFKILDEMGWSENQMQMIMLDRNKTSGYGLEKDKNIHHVPTFVVYKERQEIGRIIETPTETLEEDLFNILIGDPPTPNYAEWKPEGK